MENKKKATIKTTTSIQLEVPNKVYYSIKRKADDDTQSTGHKKTIHDKMIEQLTESNK